MDYFFKQQKRFISAVLTVAMFLSMFCGFSVFGEVLTEDDAKTDLKIISTLTEEDLATANCNWFGSNKVAIYVKITNAHKFSWLNAAVSLGTDRTGKASSKYLQASACTVKSGGYYIQDGIVGKAGTGNYVFPNVNLNTTLASGGSALSADEQKKITIDVKTGTVDTDCEILGVKFSNGAVYPKGFKVPTCESTALDVTETGEKEKLKLSLDYCDKMSSSKYTEQSWKTFQTALATAKSKYNSDLTAEEYSSARAELEKVKSNLVFVSSSESGNPATFRVLSPKDMVFEMGSGWNLGNTMDGHSGFTPNETAWQSTVTTKNMIKAVHDMGINTVRIPVTWGTMIDEKNGYKINEKWISRVQDIVDYCNSLDMYSIINIHHDGAEQSGWLRVAEENIDVVYEEFECVWRNIAERFKDYDEHLIFESMNEVTSGTNATADVLYDNPIIMNMNQIFTNVVRSTGSNNAKRWLSVPGHYALPSAVTDSRYNFSIPKDTVSDRIFVAAHIYAGPSGFYMGENMTSTVCNLSDCSDMIKKIKVLGTTWSDKGVPVIVGEFGCINKNNPSERAYYIEIFNRSCKNAGMIVPCYWDQGWFDRTRTPADYSFSIIDRENCKPIEKEVTDGLIRGTYLSGDVSTIVKKPSVNSISEITLDKESVDMVIGENAVVSATALPSNSNDVVLWSSDDENIATVYRGKIRAKGIGTTTINAFSQSGSAKKSIVVNVFANSKSTVDDIELAKNNYQLEVGEYEYIDANVSNFGENNFLSYKSSDENIVTVSPIGKIVAVSKGFACVTVTASSGVSKAVMVNVSEKGTKNYIDLAANVLYNDNSLKYYGNEVGKSVRVSGEGQYTLTFDLAQDLSSGGSKAGVSAIKNLTAIYIKDLAVTNGDATESPLEKCSIKYDKVIVDGTELTVTQKTPKEAVNSSRVFDTGGPINGYDGCDVSEVSVSSYTCNFKTVTNPKKIEIVFTLSNMKFKEAEQDDTVYAESVNMVGSKDVVINSVGKTENITVSVLPKDVLSKVYFVSSDNSVVTVLGGSAKVDSSSGYATVSVLGVGNGTATVTAYIDNAEPVVFNVSVGQSNLIKGDADFDGNITANDAVIILNYVLEKTDNDGSNYDVDQDGNVTAKDSSEVFQKSLDDKFQFK